jgi:hypothetical protein
MIHVGVGKYRNGLFTVTWEVRDEQEIGVDSWVWGNMWYETMWVGRSKSPSESFPSDGSEG